MNQIFVSANLVYIKHQDGNYRSIENGVLTDDIYTPAMVESYIKNGVIDATNKSMEQAPVSACY